MTATGGSAILTGGLTTDDVETIVIPAATRELQRIVATECTLTTSPCGCPSGSRGRQLQEIFDDNNDCEIELDEVLVNSIVQSLLAPDLGTGGDALLSFGFGVGLVPAEFTAP